MKCSLGISSFLEDISSLFHSVVFLYVFPLIAEEGFLISPCYSLECCIQVGVSFLFSFAFSFALIPWVSCPSWVPRGDSFHHMKDLYCLDMVSWVPWHLHSSMNFSIWTQHTLTPGLSHTSPSWRRGGPGVRHKRRLEPKRFREDWDLEKTKIVNNDFESLTSI